MALLTLYHEDRPDAALDTHVVRDLPLAVGRDPGAAGWRIADPDRAISRTHFIIREEADGVITVEDVSANGLLLPSGPAPKGERAPVKLGDSLRLGRMRIAVSVDEPEATVFRSPFAAAAAGLQRHPAPGLASVPDLAVQKDATVFEGPFVRPLLAPVDPAEVTLAVPSDWAPQAAPEPAPAAPAAAPSMDAALLEAFCRGAKLDMSAFAGEDPVATMKELGAVYRQMVLGLSDLMSERISVKTEYRMTRTTVHAQGNNPFKWAPAQRVAVDLLRPRTDGFLSGPAAVNDSFTDLKKHLLALLSGFREAVSATLAELEPAKAEARLDGRGFSLKSRGASAWESYAVLHAELAAEAHGDPDGRVNRGFRSGYERRLGELDAAAEAAACQDVDKAASRPAAAA